MSIGSQPIRVSLWIKCPDLPDFGRMSTILISGVMVIPIKTTGQVHWESGFSKWNQDTVTEGYIHIIWILQKQISITILNKQCLPLKMFNVQIKGGWWTKAITGMILEIFRCGCEFLESHSWQTQSWCLRTTLGIFKEPGMKVFYITKDTLGLFRHIFWLILFKTNKLGVWD